MIPLHEQLIGTAIYLVMVYAFIITLMRCTT